MLLILGWGSRKYTTSRIPRDNATTPGRPYSPVRNPTLNLPLGNQIRTSPYQCRKCGSTNLKFATVKPGNVNGNDGRPYYVCINPYCPSLIDSTYNDPFRGWVTWDDNIGIYPQNPLCMCLRNAREDVAGPKPYSPGHRFWTCSRGACEFYRRVPGT